MLNYVSYGQKNAIEEKGHYLVVGVAALGSMVVAMVVVIAMVVAAAFKIFVGTVVMVGGEVN